MMFAKGPIVWRTYYKRRGSPTLHSILVQRFLSVDALKRKPSMGLLIGSLCRFGGVVFHDRDSSHLRICEVIHALSSILD